MSSVCRCSCSTCYHSFPSFHVQLFAVFHSSYTCECPFSVSQPLPSRMARRLFTVTTVSLRFILVVLRLDGFVINGLTVFKWMAQYMQAISLLFFPNAG